MSMAEDGMVVSEELGSAAARRPRICWVVVGRCAFLALLMYCAHFWRSGEFGLYDDDYGSVPYAAVSDWSGIVDRVRQHLVWYTQGRPIQYLLTSLLPFIGVNLAGDLHGAYLVGAVVVATNAVLFYLLLRRAAFGESIAILGTLAYCLHPADTTRQFLVHANHLQTSVMMSLVAMHCYLSRRYVPAYLLGAATLLTYESAILAFLLAPLLDPRRRDRREVARVLLVHWVICGAIMLAAAGVRLAAGESRMVQSAGTPGTVIYRILTACAIGPVVALAQFVTKAAASPAWWHLRSVVVATVAGFVAIAVLLWCGPVRQGAGGEWRSRLAGLRRPLGVGGAMLVMGYSFAFLPQHYPPTEIYGRLTSVHLGAIPGGAIVVAALCEAAISLAGTIRLRWAAVVGMAAYFGVLVGFGMAMQHEYARSRQRQVVYWTRVLTLCPDIEPGTRILLEGEVRDNRVAKVSSWADPLALRWMFQYPADVEGSRLYQRSPDAKAWREWVRPDGDDFVWIKRVQGRVGIRQGDRLEQGKVILLRAGTEGIERVTGTIDVNGRPLRLKPIGEPTIGEFEAGPLYPLLIDDRQLPEELRHPGARGTIYRKSGVQGQTGRSPQKPF